MVVFAEWVFWSTFQLILMLERVQKLEFLSKYHIRNSKVFEQKGNLLSFNVNVDPKVSKNAKKNHLWAEASWAFVTFMMSLNLSRWFFKLLLFFTLFLSQLLWIQKMGSRGNFRKVEIALKSNNENSMYVCIKYFKLLAIQSIDLIISIS